MLRIIVFVAIFLGDLSECKKGARRKQDPPLMCPTGYKLFHFTGECYTILNVSTVPSDGSEICRNNGSELVSIHSMEENHYVGALGEHKGQHVSLKDAVYVGLEYSPETQSLSWTDGTPMDFNRAKFLVEDFQCAEKECCFALQFKDHFWVRWPCMRQRPSDGFSQFACKSPALSQSNEASEDETLICRTGFNMFFPHDACIKLFTPIAEGDEENVLHGVAEKRCKAYDSHLISIGSKDENNGLIEWLKQILEDDADAFIHIGLRLAASKRSDGITKDDLYWTDGSEVVYTNFREPPKRINDTFVCFDFVFPSGFWQQVECMTPDPSVQTNAYICKKPPEETD